MKKQHGYLLRQQGQSSDSLSLLAPIGLAEHSQNYSFHSKKLSKDLPGHSDEIYAVDWSQDGSKACSGGKDRVVKTWRF